MKFCLLKIYSNISFMRKIFLLSFLNIGFLQFAGAQQQLGGIQQDLSSSAASVQQMQQLIDVPVSHFTGKPNISFPIYSAKSKTITVNLGLSYDAGGIKTEQQAGFAGLGWQLTGAGMITRSVKGNQDEGIRRTAAKMTSTYNNTSTWTSVRDSFATAIGKYGGFYADGGNSWDPFTLKTAIISHNQQANSNQAPNIFAGVIDPDLARFYLGLDDGEPDMFYFNFQGYSGKFFFDRNKNPILIPYQSDLKITPVFKIGYDTVNVYYPSGSFTETYIFTNNQFESWKITTPDGLEYYFGGTPTSMVNTSYPPSINQTAVDANWSLRSGWALARIVDPATQDTVNFDYVTREGEVTRILPRQSFVRSNETLNCTVVAASQTEITKECLLSKVRTKREIVDFYYDGLFKLDSIKHSDLFTSRAYQSFHFDYGRLPSGRMKLSGFTIRNLSANLYLPYSFIYDEPASYAGLAAQDFWGYYNGATNIGVRSTAIPVCNGSGGGDRKPSWPAMRAETLTEIHLPTGGRTVFEYEPHWASSGYLIQEGTHQNFSLDSNYIGGLRIKKISRIEPYSGDTLFTHYRYNRFDNPGLSSGHLYVAPSLSWYAEILCAPYTGYYVSTHNLAESHGSHVGYKNVTVFEEKNGVRNGYTEYEFFNDTNTDSSFYMNVCDGVTNVCGTDLNVLAPWMAPYAPENLINGFEKERRVYDKDNVLLLKDETVYQTKIYSGFTRTAAISTIDRSKICGDTPQWTIYATPVPGQASWEISSGTMFYMNSYILGKKTVMPQKKISSRYHSGSPTETDTMFFYYDNPAHLKPTRIVSRSSRGDELMRQTIYSFDLQDVTSGDSTAYFMKKAFRNVPVATFNYLNNKVMSGGFSQYQMKSRADSTTFRVKDEFVLEVDAAGITAASLNISSGYPKSYAFTPSYFSKEASFIYNAGNFPAVSLNKAGVKSALLWDYNSSIKVAEALNADSADIAYTSFETSDDGQWLVAGLQRGTSASFTGTRSYSLSNGNITKGGLSAGRRYVVSYWSASGAASVNSIAPVAGKSRKGWNYFEHRLPLNTTQITISGTVTIDELRLYPADGRMNSFVYDPALGATSVNSPSNDLVFYQYDSMGVLQRELDESGNIIKTSSYHNVISTSDTAIWRILPLPYRQKPCSLNASYQMVMKQYEHVDVNPNSPTYLTHSWRDNLLEPASNATIGIAAWEPTATPLRCKKNGANENTGEQEREEKDMNPCSATYNQTRWVLAGTNTTACPLPCVGEAYRIINGICTEGTKVYTSCTYTCIECNTYTCTYYYYWPGCITSQEYVEVTNEPRTIGSPCVPD